MHEQRFYFGSREIPINEFFCYLNSTEKRELAKYIDSIHKEVKSTMKWYG